MADESTYDFVEKPAGDIAPAANSPASASQAPASSKPAEPIIERRCPHCGFRIMGDPRRGRCPECRGALDASIADLLQFSRAEWIRSMSWGPLLMAVAVLCHATAIILAWTPPPLGRISQALHIVAAASLCAGAWIVSADEGPGGPVMRRALLGVVARVASLAAAALWVIVILLLATGRMNAMHGLMVIVLLVMVVEAIALGGFLAGIAGRIPNESLATQMQNMAWVMPVVLVVAMLAQKFDPREFFSWLFFCSFPLVGGLCGLMVWAMVTLVRMTLELRGVAATAERAGRFPIDSAKGGSIQRAAKGV